MSQRREVPAQKRSAPRRWRPNGGAETAAPKCHVPGFINPGTKCLITDEQAIKVRPAIRFHIKALTSFYPRDATHSAVFATATRRVRLSHCPSVRHTPVLCLAERKQDHEMYTI